MGLEELTVVEVAVEGEGASRKVRASITLRARLRSSLGLLDSNWRILGDAASKSVETSPPLIGVRPELNERNEGRWGNRNIHSVVRSRSGMVIYLDAEASKRRLGRIDNTCSGLG